jgi:hypothetical protein
MIRLNVEELKQISGAGLAVAIGFVLVGVLIWATSFW